MFNATTRQQRLAHQPARQRVQVPAGTHVNRIFAKAGAGDRAAATRYALDHDLAGR